MLGCLEENGQPWTEGRLLGSLDKAWCCLPFWAFREFFQDIFSFGWFWSAVYVVEENGIPVPLGQRGFPLFVPKDACPLSQDPQ